MSKRINNHYCCWKRDHEFEIDCQPERRTFIGKLSYTGRIAYRRAPCVFPTHLTRVRKWLPAVHANCGAWHARGFFTDYAINGEERERSPALKLTVCNDRAQSFVSKIILKNSTKYAPLMLMFMLQILPCVWWLKIHLRKEIKINRYWQKIGVNITQEDTGLINIPFTPVDRNWQTIWVFIQ